MSTTPPTDTPPVNPELTEGTTTTTTEVPSWVKGLGLVGVLLGILASLYFFAFHLGAAVLSYNKFGSILWAIVDFFFPYFYYPYYAFAHSSPSAPTEAAPLAGGRRLVRRAALRRSLRGFHKQGFRAL
jgi:hypothetical protein